MTAYLAVFVAGYAGICYFLARSYLMPGRHIPVMGKGLSEVGIPWPGHKEDPAWCTPGLTNGHASKVVFVFAHGYGGDRGSWSEVMPALLKHGIDSVAPAMPGQDASPQPEVGFGIKEAATLNRTAAWVRGQNPEAKIIYAGVSMGGAAAWLASANDPGAAGVVTEGAYARFDETITTWFERKATGASVYLRPVVWIASAMAGLRPSEVVPMNAASKWKGKPSLVIQGGDDQLIARSHADRLVEASGGKLWVVDGAPHAGCFETRREEYISRLVEFASAL
ncbi:alpha/beta hydrolase [Fimbriimonas ginsengisoli]|uniref:AB hydrolase-1 domain-containing protein n=1 Tax=Fimbriimonas ginsengisoli Gsoil 348 TaxID=661478 RepID=A0A068NY43_FIMGI|nr:alpha/beta fold hydrolase [Fimbriimonas ginsengisoli]AIE87825.1 hypothetical protein OP10G_4457 [Fimbriimonas ginsengisoli Gsoil 348]